MTELQIFVPAILSQLAWTVAFIFAAAIAISVHDTVKKIRGRWGYLGPNGNPDEWGATTVVESPDQLIQWLESPKEQACG